MAAVSSSQQVAAVASLLLLHLAPLTALAACHAAIFRSAHTNSVRIRRNSTCSEAAPPPPLHSAQQQLRVAGAGLSRSSSVWSQLSGLKALYRDEGRAAAVTAVIVTAAAATWAPDTAARALVALHAPPPAWLPRLASLLLGLYSCLAPVLFSLRSRRVQRDLRRCAGLQPRPGLASPHQRVLSKLKSYSCPHLVLTSCQSVQVTPGFYIYLQIYLSIFVATV